MDRKTIAALSALVLTLVILNPIFPALLTLTEGVTTRRESALSAYSDDWNGLSSMRMTLQESGYDVSTIISNPLILDTFQDARGILYISIGPEKGFDRREVDAIIGFMNRGGSVLVADDGGGANSLSRKVGVEFTGHLVWSKDYVYNVSFISIDARIDMDTYRVLLNAPTSLRLTGTSHPYFNPPEIMFLTSPDSYEDTNDNRKMDFTGDQDRKGQIPVGVRVVPKGKVGAMYFISDSGFCINDMWGTEIWGESHENAEFTLRLIYEILGGSGTVIFDESRHIQATPLSNTIFLIEHIYIFTLFQRELIVGLIIIIAFLNIFGIAYLRTRNPTRFLHRFDLTYWEAFVEYAPDRLSDVRSILVTKIRAHYNLYFPDEESLIAYEPTTMTEYDLTNRKDLAILLEDRELVDFMLNPNRYNLADSLNRIVLRIDEVFPLREEMI